MAGKPHTEETKQKLRLLALARPPVSSETRQKLSDANKGKPKSEEHKIRIGLSNTGKVRSPQQREAMRQIKAEQLEKMRQAEIDRDS